jgi:hypothetical protein
MAVSRPRFELQSPKHEALHYKFKDQTGFSMHVRSKKFTQNFSPHGMEPLGSCRFRWENHIKLNIEMRMLGRIRCEWLGNEDRSLHTKKVYMCEIFLH